MIDMLLGNGMLGAYPQLTLEIRYLLPLFKDVLNISVGSEMVFVKNCFTKGIAFIYNMSYIRSFKRNFSFKGLVNNSELVLDVKVRKYVFVNLRDNF